MGNGVCSRKQRRIFQCLLLVTVVCGVMYAGLVSYEMHKQLRRTEATALKYQQHQESLSAQLQVVYEHRSRLEKSLQKERLEHKKAKEDYLVYKLEAEKSLNKEKQDSNSRVSSLQVQHQMLKNQHDELKRQYYELNDQHQAQGEDHSRLLDEHRGRYTKLQQTKEVEISQLKEHVYNLREENTQLRKAHHEIHSQLQDAQVKHQNLKAIQDQLALTLEDHKSALAAAQVQVDEYKQLKENLNREPNRVGPDPDTVAQQPHAATAAAASHDHESRRADKEEGQRPHWDTHSRLDNQEEKEAHTQSQLISQPVMSRPGLSDRDEDREGEAERKRELAEEEMAQAGQPQKLEEDLDQTHDEQMMEEEEEEREEEQPDENAFDRQRRQPQQDNKVEAPHEKQLQHQAPPQPNRLKSAYEQQQEQQRVELQRANERRQIQLRQEALQAQRERVLKEREQRLKEEREREEQQNREANRREQLLRQVHQRKRTEYENMDEDVRGENDRHTANEGDGDVHMLEEEEQPDHRVPPKQGGADAEMDPEDDPNNQGEDEFEEAENEHPARRAAEAVEEEEGMNEEEESPAPGQHVDSHRGPGRPAVEEGLVMAGNPDQQEDALDDQYQEEDEAQEDVAGGEKREEEGAEEEGEDPYNEENIEQDDAKRRDGPRKEAKLQNRANEEENYEEEEEVEEEAPGREKRTNRRAEM